MKEQTGSKPTNPRDDNQEAFAKVYTSCYTGCLAYIHKIYPKLADEEVEDICSEAMMKALRSYSGYDPAKGTITTWLFKIATNVAKDHFEDKKKQPSATMTVAQISDDDKKDGYEPDIADPDTKTPIDVILDEEREAKKNANIERLPEMERKIVLMRDDGLHYKEIAEKLGIPEPTARTKFRRAMQKLKKMMETSDEITNI